MNEKQYFWHYTSQESGTKILNSHSIYLAPIKNTNDIYEMDYFVDLFIKRLYLDLKTQKFKKKMIDSIIAIFKHNLKVELISNLKQESIFLTCITSKCDAVYQWAMYGDKGQGISIGMNRLILKKIEVKTNKLLNGTCKHLQLLKVVYSVRKQKQLTDSLVAEIVEDLVKEYKTTNGINVFNLISKYFNSFYSLAISLKNPSFKEEHEYRMVFFAEDDVYKIIIENYGQTIVSRIENYNGKDACYSLNLNIFNEIPVFVGPRNNTIKKSHFYSIEKSKYLLKYENNQE